MFKYSSKWAYIKFVSALICILWLVVMIVDGYFAQGLDASAKGWNGLMFAMLCLTSIFLIVSGLKELKGKMPVRNVKWIWIITAVIALFQSFVSIYRLFEADNRNVYDIIGALFVIVLIVVVRECRIERIFKSTVE